MQMPHFFQLYLSREYLLFFSLDRCRYSFPSIFWPVTRSPRTAPPFDTVSPISFKLNRSLRCQI